MLLVQVPVLQTDDDKYKLACGLTSFLLKALASPLIPRGTLRFDLMSKKGHHNVERFFNIKPQKKLRSMKESNVPMKHDH